MLRVTDLGEVTRFDLARTVAGRGRYWTTCYLVDDLLIDTGCAHTSRELSQALIGRPLRRIVNTHSHEDHIGGNGEMVRDRGGLEVFAHEQAVSVLADPRGKQPLHPYRRLMWGWPEPCAARAVAEGDVIESSRHAFQVLHTPGHTLDHLCLFEPDAGWLFAGDLYVGGKDRAVTTGCNIWQVVSSLERVADLPIRVLYPGSARVPEDPKGALLAKIDHLESLGEHVLDLHHKGRSPRQIARALCGGPMPIELFTLGHFSRKSLVLSYIQCQPDRDVG